MIDIYEDESFNVKIPNNVIYEGCFYYIDFKDNSEDFIRKEIKKSKLKDFINWHPKNSIATLKIINYVGIYDDGAKNPE